MTPDSASEELEPLQGTWYIHALETNGNPQPAGAFAGATITVTADRFTTSAMGHTYSGRLTADGSRLELHFTAGPERGNVNHGLYKISAGGVWTICLDTTGGPAPRSLSTTRGKPGLVLQTLRREPPAVERAAAPDTGEVIEAMQGDWTMVSCVRDGGPLSASMVSLGRRHVRGTEFVLQFSSRLFQAGRIYAVPGEPGAFDLVLTDGGLCRGIFEIAGDTLTTCFGAPDAPRPAEFASRHGEGCTLAEWRRAVR